MTDPDGEGRASIDRMNDVDAILWALEATPVLRANVVVVGVLDRFPGRQALADHLERATRLLTRLRQRVVSSPIGVAPPRWELDPAFDLDHHLRYAAVPAEAGAAGLLAFAETLVTEGFDRARPPWQLFVVDGLEGGKAGVVAKIHHALVDGVGAVRLATALFDLDGRPSAAGLPPRPDEPLSTGVERALDDLDYGLRRTAGYARSALPWVARGLREAVVTPDSVLRRAVVTARSLARLTSPGTRPLSPVMTGRSLRTHLDVISLDLAGLKAAGRAAGGTVNDVFLAAAAGGLRGYHEKHGSRPEALRVGMAVNLRAGDAGAGEVFGNSFAPIRLLLPLQIADPCHRVAALGAAVRRSREEPLRDLLSTAAALAGQVSVAASAAALGTMLRGTDVIASNVAGSPVDLYLAGGRLERLVAFGPRSGAALNLTLLSHAGRVEVGVNVDGLAIPDPDTMMACLRSAFDEVLALGG